MYFSHSNHITFEHVKACYKSIQTFIQGHGREEDKPQHEDAQPFLGSWSSFSPSLSLFNLIEF
jgi:hypothetical protein